MMPSGRHISSNVLLLLISCSLVLLFSGCDLFGNSSKAVTSTPQPTLSLPKGFTLYTGNGYSVGYPQGWKVESQQTAINFSDPQGVALFTVNVVNNPRGLVSATNQLTLAQEAFKQRVKHYKKVSTASTTTIAGDTWRQDAATGDFTPQGQSASASIKAILLADNHPASSAATKGFTIVYSTAVQLFDLENTSNFQPMLQSFHFV